MPFTGKSMHHTPCPLLWVFSECGKGSLKNKVEIKPMLCPGGRDCLFLGTNGNDTPGLLPTVRVFFSLHKNHDTYELNIISSILYISRLWEARPGSEWAGQEPRFVWPGVHACPPCHEPTCTMDTCWVHTYVWNPVSLFLPGNGERNSHFLKHHVLDTLPTLYLT